MMKTDRAGQLALGRRLAQLRGGAGLTQGALAQRLSYSRSTLANVETGRQRVPREFWVRCDALLASGSQLTDSYDRAADAALRHSQISAFTSAALRAERSGKPRSSSSGEQPSTAHLDQSVVDQSAIQLARVSSTIGHGVTELLEESVLRLAADFGQAPAGDAFARAAAIRDAADELAGRARRPADLADLYLVSALSNALMASAAFDLAAAREAMSLAGVAYTYADLAGHRPAMSWIDGLLASLCNWAGRQADALVYVERGLHTATTARARFRLLHVAARSHAHRRDIARLTVALADAERSRGQEGWDTDEIDAGVGGEFAFGDLRADACAGAAWLTAHDASRAVACLSRVVGPSADEAGNTAPRLGAHLDLAHAALMQQRRGDREPPYRTGHRPARRPADRRARRPA